MVVATAASPLSGVHRCRRLGRMGESIVVAQKRYDWVVMAKLPVLFLTLLTIVNGQTVQMTASATVNGQNRFVIGTETNGVHLEFLPVSATLTPPATSLANVEIGRITVRPVGNPLAAFLPFAAAPVIFSIQQGSALGTLRGQVSINYAAGYPVITFSMPVGQWTQLTGVTYSDSGALVYLWNAFTTGPPLTYTIVGRVTRDVLRVDPPVIRATVRAGQVFSQSLRLSQPYGIPGVTDTSSLIARGEFSSFRPDSGDRRTVLFSAFHSLQYPGTTTSVARLDAEGYPPAFVPVELTLVPSPDTPTLTPPETAYFYQRGTAPPPSRTFTVEPVAATLEVVSWDSGWMNVTQNGNQFTVTPLLTNKPVGSHHTKFSVRSNGDFVAAHASVSFYVNDGPGALNISREPSSGGSVAVSPSTYENGTSVTLTATPAPGFAFGRWRGAANDVANPLRLTVNGPMGIVAEFIPVPGTCTYSIRPSKIVVAPSEFGEVQIQTQNGCPWSVEAPPAGMEFDSTLAGVGPGVVRYFARLNAGDTYLRVANQYLMIQVVPVDATVAFLGVPPSLPAAGGAVPFRFGQSSFPRVASQPWVRFPHNRGPFLGVSDVLLSVDANPTNQPRTAYLNMSGTRVPLLQRAADPDSPFEDVAASHPFADHITLLKRNNATDSCGPNRFCPDADILRSEMAELLVRAILGTENFAFPQTPRFQDVPANHPQFKWIQKIAELELTVGCTATQYCPADKVTRAQMAAFLARAKFGRFPSQTAASGYLAPYGRTFEDLTRDDVFATPIEAIRRLGITRGCYSNAYCPNDFTTRGQMAVFLVRAFFTH